MCLLLQSVIYSISIVTRDDNSAKRAVALSKPGPAGPITLGAPDECIGLAGRTGLAGITGRTGPECDVSLCCLILWYPHRSFLARRPHSRPACGPFSIICSHFPLRTFFTRLFSLVFSLVFTRFFMIMGRYEDDAGTGSAGT